MAGKRRKLWSSLKPSTRARKLGFYKKQGLTPQQVAARYNAGTLGPQSRARGHAATPEHGITQALHDPGKYRKYLRKKERSILSGPVTSPEDIAYALNEARDRAYRNFHDKLYFYVYYNDQTVLANIYGGSTNESGPVPGMSLAQATWTARADTEEIRSMASEQYRGNPWGYH